MSLIHLSFLIARAVHSFNYIQELLFFIIFHVLIIFRLEYPSLREERKCIDKPFHKFVSAFMQLDTKLVIFKTGIKEIDLLAPYRLEEK